MKARRDSPIAEIVNIIERSDGKRLLELQANIGGQCQTVVLPLDALQDFGVRDQAAVEQYQKIRRDLEGVEAKIPFATEIAAHLLDMIEAIYELPKRGPETG